MKTGYCWHEKSSVVVESVNPDHWPEGQMAGPYATRMDVSCHCMCDQSIAAMCGLRQALQDDI
jgi:hypothetical protein